MRLAACCHSHSKGASLAVPYACPESSDRPSKLESPFVVLCAELLPIRSLAGSGFPDLHLGGKMGTARVSKKVLQTPQNLRVPSPAITIERLFPHYVNGTSLQIKDKHIRQIIIWLSSPFKCVDWFPLTLKFRAPLIIFRDVDTRWRKHDCL